ncbi:MAG: Inositol 2-dehydrogenase/D-chiro-inositol 3-dehydrogenase [Verrucomicrobiae bacterium]|nr:Inositol 2-dehydrogenase/D-chiro-inositol 3-dehydrogenase [Verrucomicrobiae bacterium]
MKHSKFRVGVIGTGGIFRGAHVHGWKAIPDAQIVAVADINADRAASLAKEMDIPQVFTDYRELVKLDLDAVDVCTPNGVHTPAVLAALNAGMHVVCEKPLATTTKDVRLMGELADKKKLVLMTAQHQRWTASALAIKRWAEAGNLGDVYHARVRAMRRAWLPIAPGFIDKKLSGGGPCMDIGVHALDAALWVMGFPKPVRVTGTAKVNFAQTDKIPGMWGEWDRKMYSVEDFAAGFVHFDNGATMTLESAWLGHQTENEDMSFQLFGMNGGVKWPSGEFATVANRTFVQGNLTWPTRIDRPHTEEILAFYDSVVNRKPTPVPWTETIKVIAILEAIYKSQATGREVALKLA